MCYSSAAIATTKPIKKEEDILYIKIVLYPEGLERFSREEARVQLRYEAEQAIEDLLREAYGD